MMDEYSIKLQETLHKLKDIHLPNEPLWWPPAPGIIALLIIMTLLISLCIYKAVQRSRIVCKKRIKNNSIEKLDAIKNRIHSRPINESLTEINMLIKKIIKLRDHKSPALSLTGTDFLQYLSSTSTCKFFQDNRCKELLNYEYMNQSTINKTVQEKHNSIVEQYINGCKDWINYNI